MGNACAYIKANSSENSAGCWIWQGSKYPTGYGYCRYFGYTSTLAHRIAYEAFVGPLKGGENLRRLCANKACCNPEHYAPRPKSKADLILEIRKSERAKLDQENAVFIENAIKLWMIKTGHNSRIANDIAVSTEAPLGSKLDQSGS